MTNGKCRKCGRVFNGNENHHQRGYCSFRHEIEDGDDAANEHARRIGDFFGEIYNPDLER